MLKTEWYADYGQAKEGSECKVKHRYLYSSHKDPDHIHYDRQTASVVCIGLNVMAERPEGETGEFDELDAERNADNGDAEQHTYNKVVKADQESAQYEPKNIA